MSLSSHTLPISLILTHQATPSPVSLTTPFPGFSSIFPKSNAYPQIAVPLSQPIIDADLTYLPVMPGLVGSSTPNDANQHNDATHALISTLTQQSVSSGNASAMSSPLLLSSSSNGAVNNLLNALQNPPITPALPQNFTNSLFHSLQKLHNPALPRNKRLLYSLHIGQYFRCVVSITNTSASHTLTNLHLSLECFTSKSTTSLPIARKIKSMKLPGSIAPKGNYCDTINIMLNEKGTHVLSCYITGDLVPATTGTVASPQQQQRQSASYRKLYPFYVTVPVSMRDLRVTKLPHLTDAYRVKMQLQNVSGEILHVQHVQLNLKDATRYKLRDYSTMMHTEDAHDEPAMLHMKPMQVQETRKFFFDVLPKSEEEVRNEAAEFTEQPEEHPLQDQKSSLELGIIEIKWISSMMESGTLSTNMISKPTTDTAASQSTTPGAPPAQLREPPLGIRLTLPPDSNTLQLVSERPCPITFEFYNTSQSDMKLTLHFNLQQMFPMIIAGKTVTHLEVLPPNQTLRHTFEVVPLRAGNQVLGHGILAYDNASSSTYYFGNSPANIPSGAPNTFIQCCLRNVLVLMPHSHLSRPSEDISDMRNSEEAHVEETKPQAHEISQKEDTAKRDLSESQMPGLDQSLSRSTAEVDEIDLLASMMQSRQLKSEEASQEKEAVENVNESEGQQQESTTGGDEPQAGDE